MADLDEIFRTLQQQQNYLAEVSKKIETDIEQDRERQLAAQREREKEEAKRRAEIDARAEVFRKQREEALRQRMERMAAQPPPSFALPPPPKASIEDSSTAGPLRLPSYNPGLYESLRISRRGRDAEDGPSITDLLEISDPQLTAEEAWCLLPPPNLPPPPPPPPSETAEDGDDDDSDGKTPSLRHSYSGPRSPTSLPSPVSPRTLGELKGGSHVVVSTVTPMSDPTLAESSRTARSASELQRANLTLSAPDQVAAGITRPRAIGVRLTPLNNLLAAINANVEIVIYFTDRFSGLFSLFRGKKSADPTLEATLDIWPRRLQRISKIWPVQLTEKSTVATFMEVTNDFIYEWAGPLGHDGTGTLQLDDESELTPFYESVFYEKEHTNYIALDPELGPIVISSECATGRRLRCIVRTKAGEERVLVPGMSRKRKELEKLFPQFAKVTFLVLQSRESPKLCQDLLAYEVYNTLQRHLVVHNFKFGVLYWKTGQTQEDEFYQNNTLDLSPAFNHFVSLLGDKVPLINWSRFKGGLRTTDNSTGTHSVYTDHRGFEIMYHVAPMIPNPSIDKQQLDRKRHLGNDIVVLIFRDQDNTQPFNPKIMRSQVNQIFLLVQPVAPKKYRVGMMAKTGIPIFGPALPIDGLIAEAALRPYLLTKMINGERAAMLGPDFASKLVNSRQKLLTHMFNNHKEHGKP